ncbi:hypothetical protein CDL12_00373 [Handroanthus impetiginosus]|uniref:WRKY domain-containing protein n=1 Tax=Handroanthus impetiginosus TaxID=429701 RepID=A0A2G9IB35_9LAMI|nr:hypothetical protein CDL12_00373 [Handroanthus impetiginosus]
MSSASESMINQSLLEDQEMFGIFPFHTNFTPLPLGCNNQPFKTLANINPSSLTPDLPLSLFDHHHSLAPKQKELDFPAHFPGSQILSLQKSTPNYWAFGDLSDCMNMKRSGDHLGVSPMKMKKIKARRKMREPRFCFKTMSDVDVLDDGYKWRKYGQKVVKDTLHPRSYYRCTQDNCRVKKRVERLAEDPRMVITTYEGRHIHSPSHDDEDSQASAQLNNFFW